MKPKFKPEDYPGNYAMHCDTEEKARIFCNFLHENGKVWIDGNLYTSINQWEEYKSNTVYNFNKGVYENIRWYQKRNYTILKFDDFDWSNNMDDKEKSKFEKFCDVLDVKPDVVYTDGLSLYKLNNSTIFCKPIDGNTWYYSNSSLTWLLNEDTKLKEYCKEPTKRDIEIMKAFKVLYGYRWFACDKDGDVWAFISKPKKEDDEWHPLDCKECNLTERTLSHISWEDNEPYYFEG